jgi:hypothetical protein
MRIHSVIACVLLASALPPVAAQTPSGPVSGAVLEPGTGCVLRILGFPGAATLGGGISVEGARSAAVAPAGRWALLRPPGTRAVLIGDLLGKPAVRTVEGIDERVDTIAAISPAADAVLLASSDFSQSQVVSGMPEHPNVRPVSTWDRAGLKPIALAPGGDSLIVGVRDDGGYSVFWAAGGAAVRHLIGRFPGLADWTLSVDGRDAVAAAGDAVEYVRDVFGAAARTTLIRGDEGFGRPVCVAAPAGRAVAAMSDGRVLIFELRSGRLTHELSLPAPATSCRNAGPDLFQLTSSESLPVYVLDLAGEPAVRFIPGGGRNETR